METKQCYFCGRGGQLLFSSVQNSYVHTQCILENMNQSDPKAISIAKEFDMVSDYSECNSGCGNCMNKWCGR